MKNPTSRSAPRGGSSASYNSTTDQFVVRDATAPFQVTSSDPLAGDGICVARFWKSPRNRNEVVHVSLKSYEGNPFLDARVYAANATGQMRPTQRGISIGVRTLGRFIQAIGDGYRRAAELGLIPVSS
jgi:hypothetical protein